MPHEGTERAVYRMLVEQTRELLCLHDIDGTFRFVSPSVKAVLGYSPGELVGRHPLEFVHDDDRAAAERALSDLSDAQHAQLLTLRFCHAEGAYVWLEVQSRLLRGPDDRLEHIVSSSRDVSERVALLRRATDAEAHMRSVLASFDDLVFVFDGEGLFLEYYQPRERRDLAKPPEDFLGRHFADVLPEHVSTRLAEALEAARSDGATHVFEYELAVGDTGRTFLAKVTPLLRTGGDAHGYVGVVQDVTDLRAAEQARLGMVRATERAERLEGLSELARGTAHEFNNLLTVIQGNAELAMEDLDDGDEAVGHLMALIHAARKAGGVTRQLLRYAGDTVGGRETLDAGTWIRSVADEVRASLPAHVNLELDVEGDPPAVFADADLLSAAVLSLVRNAFEALGSDGGTIGIRLRTRQCDEEDLAPTLVHPVPEPGTFLAVAVDDDGEGIDGDLLPRIFEPFVSGRFLGRGLGLAEVAGTIRSHEGAILVPTDRERGTRIVLLFPALEDQRGDSR